MQKTKFSKILSLLICIALITATALFATSCSDNPTTQTEGPETTASENEATTVADETTTVADGTANETAPTEIGEGEKQFTFTVVDADKNETVFTVNTDEETVGAALLKLQLIAGEDSQYGLYVKTVNGTTLDYDKDGMYWAFYENGAYASAGVDSTNITNGAAYSFKAEK